MATTGTPKTVAALDALLTIAPQFSGAVPAAALRDLLVSLLPAVGSMYMATPAATAISEIGTFVKAAGTTAPNEASTSRYITEGTNNRLTFTGSVPQRCVVKCIFSFTTTANNQVCDFRLALNGVPIVASEQSRKTGTGSDVGGHSVEVDLDLSQGDYIELWVANATSATNVTVSKMHMCVTGTPL